MPSLMFASRLLLAALWPLAVGSACAASLLLTGGIVHTVSGPTLTNVNDFRALLIA